MLTLRSNLGCQSCRSALPTTGFQFGSLVFRRSPLPPPHAAISFSRRLAEIHGSSLCCPSSLRVSPAVKARGIGRTDPAPLRPPATALLCDGLAAPSSLSPVPMSAPSPSPSRSLPIATSSSGCGAGYTSDPRPCFVTNLYGYDLEFLWYAPQRARILCLRLRIFSVL